MRTLSVVLVVLLSLFTVASIARSEPLPESWGKTMTNDPTTNFFLKKYSEKSPLPAVQYYRDMYLLALLSGCDTLDFRLKTFFEFEKTIGYGAFTEKQIKDAKFEVGSFMRGMDMQAAVHLCAGGDYMFGDRGVLIQGVLRPNGKPLQVHYDPANPYITLEIDRIEEAFKNQRK